MRPLKIILPTKWIDLSNRQLIYVARLWKAEYPHQDFLVKAFLMLTGLKLVTDVLPVEPISYFYTHKSIKKPFLIDTDLMSEMCERCRFLLTPDEVNPVKRIGLKYARHFRLYNATFEEYLMAENYFFAFTQTKKDEHLDNLMACLYRLPWQKWDAGTIQERGKTFRKLDPAIKLSVLLWYIGFRTYVPKRCKLLFSGNGASGSSFNSRDYINGMIHQLSNGDITIKSKLLSSPCWDALDELEQRAVDHNNSNNQK